MARFGEHESLEEQTAHEFSDIDFIRIVSGKIRRNAGIKELLWNIGDMFVVIW